MKASSQFLSLYSQLKDAAKLKSIPPKMLDKLNFLAKQILNQQISHEQFINIQSEQLNSMGLMDQDTKVKLFISVASCLLGKVELDYVNNKQVYIKNYNDLISFWKLIYITYDSDNLYITKNSKKQQFSFNKLRVSKIINKRGRKFTFKIKFDSKQYLIGTQKEIICSQLLKKIKQLINLKKLERQSKLKIQYMTIPSELSCRNDLDQIFQDKKIEDQQDLDPVVQQFQIQQIQNETEYILNQNGDKYRILNHKNNKRIFKIFLTLDFTNIEDIIQLFVKNKQWNIQTTETKVINKISNNMYIVHQKLKKYGYTSWARDLIVMKYAFKHKNKYYLVQKSVQHRQYPPSKAFVRAHLLSKVTTFICDKKQIVIITRIQIDFKGYNSDDDNRLMSQKYLNSYKKFSNYCLQRSLLQMNKRMFNFSRQKPQFKDQNNRFKTEQSQEWKTQKSYSMKNNKIDKNIQTQSSKGELLEINHSSFIVENLQNTFISFLQCSLTDKINEKLFNSLEKLQHYYHPLKHRYSFEVNQKQSKKHSDVPPNDFVFQNGDWRLNKQNQMIFANQSIIDAQKDTMKWIFKQIGANILKGKSIMNMSLPVDIFDHRSILQRSVASYGYAPIYFSDASKTMDQIEQLKILTNFLISTALLQLRIQKPFNPILGQTFQGYINGIPFYSEQISHHPPITAFYAKTNQFQFSGLIDSHADLGINTCYAANYSPIKIKLMNTGLTFECYYPACEVSGLMYGQRKFKLVNKAFLVCKEKELLCQISYGKQKKDIYPAKRQKNSSEIYGGIFKVSKQFLNKFLKEKKKPKFAGVTVNDIIQTYSILSGAWNDKILFDDKVYRTLYDPLPYQLDYELYSLPSNSNYRTDILYRRLGNLAMAQSQKERLQTEQRRDRKLRQKYRKK